MTSEESSSAKITYSDDNYQKLVSEIKSLSRFPDVASWDARAQEEINKIIQTLQKLETEITALKQTVQNLEQEKSDKSFFSRLFSTNKEQKEAEKLIVRYSNYMETLEKMAAQLQELIDFTPNSAEEQRSLLKELQIRKKELQADKREIAAEMKAVRTSARQESANLAVTAAFFPKMASSQRRSIIYSKEAALRPHESAVAAIERQINQTERDIIWVKKFSSEVKPEGRL